MNSINKKKLELISPFLSAPLEGFTDKIFMNYLDNQGGCGILFTRFTKVTQNSTCQPPLPTFLPLNYSTPVFLQLLGRLPQNMADVAEMAEKEGFHGIDLNFGCPSKIVTKKNCGSALLEDPELINEIVQTVNERIEIPVTAKIRTGFKDSHLFREVLHACEDGGAAMVTVHGRLQEEMYNGLADWDKIIEAAELLKIPVCGNGDIQTPEEAVERLNSTPCAAVMIGRGSVRNPNIFKESTLLSENKEISPMSMKDLRIYYRNMSNKYIEMFDSPKMALIRLKIHLSYSTLEENIQFNLKRSKTIDDFFFRFSNFL